MNDQILNAENHIKNIEEFLNHNLNLGYIKPETTILELLEFTKNIKEKYISLISDIDAEQWKIGISKFLNDNKDILINGIKL